MLNNCLVTNNHSEITWTTTCVRSTNNSTNTFYGRQQAAEWTAVCVFVTNTGLLFVLISDSVSDVVIQHTYAQININHFY